MESRPTRPDAADPTSIDYPHIFASLPHPCLVLTRELITVDANAAYLSLVNMDRQQLLGRFVFDVFPPQDEDKARVLRASLMHVIEERESHTIPLLHYPVAAGDGLHDRFWTVNNTPLLDRDGALIGILNCPVDVTQLLNPRDAMENPDADPMARLRGADVRQITLHLEKQRNRFRQLMQQALGFVAILRGPTHVFELANDAYYALVGRRDILDKPVRRALPEIAGQGFYELLDEVYETAKPFIGRAMPVRVQFTPDSPLAVRHIDFIFQPILDDEGEISGIFVQGYDVTEVHELTQAMSYEATHDSLTGLVNRREFESRLVRAVEEAAAGGGPHSLIYLDLDQFKVINDSSGHAAGDELLRQVGMHLRANLSPSDTVARLGGDEFGILLNGKDAAAAFLVAEQLRCTIDNIDFSWGR